MPVFHARHSLEEACARHGLSLGPHQFTDVRLVKQDGLAHLFKIKYLLYVCAMGDCVPPEAWLRSFSTTICGTASDAMVEL